VATANLKLPPAVPPTKPIDSHTALDQPVPSTDQEQKPEQNTSPPTTGQSPNEVPKTFLCVEDWKPWVFSKIKWVWSGFGATNFTNFTCSSVAAFNAGENWWVFLAVGFVVLIFTLIIAAFITGILLLIWYFNRKEIGEYIKFSKQSLVNPNSYNLGLKFEKVGEKL
jgi:hypothetical protein